MRSGISPIWNSPTQPRVGFGTNPLVYAASQSPTQRVSVTQGFQAYTAAQQVSDLADEFDVDVSSTAQHTINRTYSQPVQPVQPQIEQQSVTRSYSQYVPPSVNRDEDAPLGQPSQLQRATSLKDNIKEKLPEVVNTALVVAEEKWLIAKQVLLEKLGKVEATEDPDVQPKVEKLWKILAEFDKIVGITYKHVANTRAYRESLKNMSSMFSEIGVQEQDMIGAPFEQLSQIHRVVYDEGESLGKSIEKLYDTAITFRNAAIEDSIATCDKYERSRVHFDVAKNRLSLAQTTAANDPARVSRNNVRVYSKQEAYKQLGTDLATKVILLNEKRAQILSDQLRQYSRALLTFHAKCALYFTGARPIETKDFLKKNVTAEFQKLLLKEDQTNGTFNNNTEPTDDLI